MVDILVFIGIACVALAFWRGRISSAREKQDLDRMENLRDELFEAKKEVGSLLRQLEVVSEKVVEEISAKVDEVRNGQYQTSSPDPPELGAGSSADSTDDYALELFETENVKPQVELGGRVPREPVGKTIKFPVRKESQNLSGPVSALNHLVPEPSPKHQMVYAMAKLGVSEEEIAKQMKMGKGEVRLIIQLKRKGEEVNA